MTKHKEEELEAKSVEIANEITTVLKRHSPQPGVVFLAALSANLKRSEEHTSELQSQR